MAKLERKDVLRIAEEKKVRFIRLWFTDILSFNLVISPLPL